MEKTVLCIWLMAPLLCRAQAFNDLRPQREHKTVGIVRKTPAPRAETRAAARTIDTVFVCAELPVRKRERPASPPQTGGMSAPLDQLVVTSGYGMRFHPVRKRWAFHAGVDFGAFRDTVRSVLDGIVRHSGHDGGLGYFVRVGHGNHVLTYAHLSQYFHLPGEPVKAGEPLGITGSTGLSTGEHLHFSVHRDGMNLEPMGFLTALAKLKNTIKHSKMKTDSTARSAIEKMKQAASPEGQDGQVELTPEEADFLGIYALDEASILEEREAGHGQ